MAKCQYAGCNTKGVMLPKKYCDDHRKQARLDVQRRYNRKNRSILGKRLAYLIDYEERIGHTEPPLTASQWRNEPPISNQP